MTDKPTAQAHCYWSWDCPQCARQNLSEYDDTHEAQCNHCGASVTVEIIDSYAGELFAENERLREACKAALDDQEEALTKFREWAGDKLPPPEKAIKLATKFRAALTSN